MNFKNKLICGAVAYLLTACGKPEQLSTAPVETLKSSTVLQKYVIDKSLRSVTASFSSDDTLIRLRGKQKIRISGEKPVYDLDSRTYYFTLKSSADEVEFKFTNKDGKTYTNVYSFLSIDETIIPDELFLNQDTDLFFDEDGYIVPESVLLYCNSGNVTAQKKNTDDGARFRFKASDFEEIGAKAGHATLQIELKDKVELDHATKAGGSITFTDQITLEIDLVE